MHTLVIIAALLAVAVALPISPAARHQAKKHADNSDPEFGVRGLFKAPEDVLATRHIKRTIMGVIGSSGYSNPSSSSESFGSKGWSTGGRDDDWRDAERRRRKRKRCRGKNKEKPRCRGRGRWGSASAESNLNIPMSWDDAEMHFMSWEDPEVAHGHKGKREEASRDVAHSTSLLHSRVIRSLIPGLSYPKPPTQSSSSSFGSKGWSSSSSSTSWRDEEDEWRAWRRRERRRRRRKCRGKKGQKKAACKRRWRNRGRGRKGPADGKAQHKLHSWETFESPTASKAELVSRLAVRSWGSPPEEMRVMRGDPDDTPVDGSVGGWEETHISSPWPRSLMDIARVLKRKSLGNQPETQKVRSAPTKVRSAATKSRSMPTKIRAMPTKIRAMPTKLRAAPTRERRTHLEQYGYYIPETTEQQSWQSVNSGGNDGTWGEENGFDSWP